MKQVVCCVILPLVMLCLCSCGNGKQDVADLTVDFEWQPIDDGSQDNPEIRVTGVPAGTKRFYVSLVDLNNNGFDHGGGFADNDGSGIIARGATKGTYNGPSPPFPSVIHTYEITVEAMDEKGKTIGKGKTAKVFTPRQ